MIEDHFGEDVAAHYDGGPMFEAALLGSTIDLLAELAGDGGALELAIGTGRVAIPLADRGVRVAGIELSTAMADRLRAKDRSNRIRVTMGDMDHCPGSPAAVWPCQAIRVGAFCVVSPDARALLGASPTARGL